MNDVTEVTGLPPGVAEALANGTLGDPFAVLGPHDTATGRIVRAFLPGALGGRGAGARRRQVAGAARAGRAARSVRRSRSAAAEPYRLRIAWPGAVQETEDPYSFGPLLGELDLHLFNEGRHFELASHLGANVVTIDGVTGVRFAVWAPNARAVSVVGDFNTWDPRRHPMRLRYSIRRVGAVHPASRGRARATSMPSSGLMAARLPLKADPLARATEPPPATASVVADPTPHVWHDEMWMRQRAAPPCHRRADLDL